MTSDYLFEEISGVVKRHSRNLCVHCGMDLDAEQEVMPGRVHSCRGSELAKKALREKEVKVDAAETNKAN